jgi:glutaredoxin 3
MRTLFATLAGVVLLLVGLHVAAARQPAGPAADAGAGALERMAAVAHSLKGLGSGLTGGADAARAGGDEGSDPADPNQPEKAGARVYWQYVDASGRVAFVKRLEEVPPAYRAGAGRIELEAKQPAPGGRATAAKGGSTRTASARRPWAGAAAGPEVVIYTAPWCGWCRKALAYLDQKGVPYENRDIEANPANKSELLQRSGRTSIPFLVIGGESVRGFDQARIEELLARG